MKTWVVFDNSLIWPSLVLAAIRKKQIGLKKIFFALVSAYLYLLLHFESLMHFYAVFS